MMKLSLAVFIIIVLSCNAKPKSLQPGTELLGSLALPADSLAFYFPKNSFSDKPNVDSFVQNWYGSALYSFREPRLFGNFSDQSIYRFLWLRSFHQPVVFTLHKLKKNVWLNTKILDRQPRFRDDRVRVSSKGELEAYRKDGFVTDTSEPRLLARTADRKAEIMYNKTIPLSSNEWNTFEQLLAKANYSKLPTHIDDGSTDGASWVIEWLMENKYHLVDYHSPSDNDFEKAGLFLFKLSGIKEEIY